MSAAPPPPVLAALPNPVGQRRCYASYWRAVQPMILVGKMWTGLVHWATAQLLRPELSLANPENLAIPHCVETADEAIALIHEHHVRWLQFVLGRHVTDGRVQTHRVVVSDKRGHDSSGVRESVLIVMGLTPTGGEATASQLRTACVCGWRLPNRWRWDSALLFTTDSDNGNRFETWSPTTVLRLPLGERLQVHGEYFGQISQDRLNNFSHHFFGPGMRYLITPNLEVGLRVGWGLNDQSARFFSNVGFGWQYGHCWSLAKSPWIHRMSEQTRRVL